MMIGACSPLMSQFNECNMLQYMEHNAKNISLMMWQDEKLSNTLIKYLMVIPNDPVMLSLYQDHNSTFLKHVAPYWSMSWIWWYNQRSYSRMYACHNDRC